MKTFSFIVLLIAVASDCDADDGRYRPELYNNNNYRSLINTNSKSFYTTQQPFAYKALDTDLLAPYVKYGNDVYQTTAPTPVVSYRTPIVPLVTPTYRPFVYSTPHPYAQPTKPPTAIYHKSVNDGAASVIREDRTYDENNYHFAYETDNGIAAEESGSVERSINGVGGGTRVRGFYEYIGDDGLKYRVDYVADENGYRASGAHLPKAP